MADAMPDAICINYDVCERTSRQLEVCYRKSDIPIRESSKSDGKWEEEEEEEEKEVEDKIQEKPMLSSDAPFVKGNKTHAIVVLAEDESLYDELLHVKSERGFSFR